MSLLKKFFLKKIKQENIQHDNNLEIHKNAVDRVKLTINGYGNHVKIGNFNIDSGLVTISITGNNNIIEIGDHFFTSMGLNILIGQSSKNYGPCNRVKVDIKEWVRIEGASITTFNSGSSIEIGEQCMFSDEVILMQTDSHPIFNENQEIVNFANKMSIGNHVWIGTRVIILKNSYIADGSIVGAGTVLSGQFIEKNCCIIGNPARIIRKNIQWTDYAREYVRNKIDPMPNILSFSETVKRIKEGLSVAFLDQKEFELLIENVSQFGGQYISQGLRNLFDNKNLKFNIGINSFWWKSLLEIEESSNRDSIKIWLQKNLIDVEKIINNGSSAIYAESEVAYIGKYNRNELAHKFGELRQIWDKEDIVIVSNGKNRTQENLSIFNNANTIERVSIEEESFFKNNCMVQKKFEKLSKNKKIFVILNSLGKILVYDLFLSGYQVIDLGETVKNYEQFIKSEL